ncbi:MAG: threonine--tRNA ligase [Candidatus Marinimicrobia bacterium]|nr:threonine--tRNA ligase [Candidatus Neomarinimicrobiota bacterium]MCF7828268.1 threonine--tRNA ligase [Candidatus Neomarinimicrobiota bacterium]MCF7879557.1 threonine--tRNA ligase [Candidatus Neomarinimicrobiota bacterium]
MNEITVTLPDGSSHSYPKGTTPLEVARSIGEGLARAAVAAKIDGKQVDITRPIEDDCSIEIITIDSDEGHEVLWHSTSHLMAQAVKQLYPEAQIAIGPPIEKGFYYDIDVDDTFSDEDLEKIEERMMAIANEDYEVEREEKSIDDLIDLFDERNEQYKIELLKQIRDEEGDNSASIYWQGDFVDLCRGPHAPSTGWIKHFKLLNVAGAYWRGDENNQMLQRIYGTSWPTEKELQKYIEQLEEAKKRDHRKLGKELDLFSFHKESPASPFFHPKGTIIYNGLIEHIREMYQEQDYDEVITPQILDLDLWHRSGHYENYKENMYFTSQLDGKQQYAVKPMNCPTHTFIYDSQKRSYRDLPIRIADFGRLHRYERTGATGGLTRVRSFAQDDAHIFCMVEQIQSEVVTLVEAILHTYELFDFDSVEIELSTMPEKHIGDVETWEHAESILKEALESQGYEYDINEGDGAFYGPKIDFIVKDALDRDWQLGTVQLDFMMPERFDLTYTASSGDEERPVMVHRAILGSLERFIGILLEHTYGELPLWLTPLQFQIMPITDDHHEYAHDLKKQFTEAGIRVEVDDRSEKVGAKIRESELQKVPYMGIVGDREVENGTISLRQHTVGDLGAIPINEVIKRLQQEIQEKRMRVNTKQED